MSYKERWKKISLDAIKDGTYFNLTTTNSEMRRILKPLFGIIPAGSKILDLGAGDLAFKALFSKDIQYVSADIVKTSAELDYVCDAENLPFPDKSFEYVLCSAVLEHTREPQKVVGEIKRILKDNGVVFLTAPHIHYLHGEPYDFWRFTKYGLMGMLQKENFHDIEVWPVGGAISFSASITGPAFLVIASYIPFIRSVARPINCFFNYLFIGLDRIIDRNKKFALGYIARAQK